MRIRFLMFRFNIAALQGDKEQMDRVVALAAGKRGTEHPVANAEALALARLGRLTMARQASSRGIELAGNKAEARGPRATRPHERYGKPCVETQPRPNGTRPRRWHSRPAAMSIRRWPCSGHGRRRSSSAIASG